jgi:hypothetical protein
MHSDSCTSGLVLQDGAGSVCVPEDQCRVDLGSSDPFDRAESVSFQMRVMRGYDAVAGNQILLVKFKADLVADVARDLRQPIARFAVTDIKGVCFSLSARLLAALCPHQLCI